MANENPLQEAVRHYDGNLSALAARIGRNQSTVWDWVKRGFASPDAFDDIIAAVDGKITKDQLLASAAKIQRKNREKRARAAAAKRGGR